MTDIIKEFEDIFCEHISVIPEGSYPLRKDIDSYAIKRFILKALSSQKKELLKIDDKNKDILNRFLKAVRNKK